jgi:hypothetical protein
MLMQNLGVFLHKAKTGIFSLRIRIAFESIKSIVRSLNPLSNLCESSFLSRPSWTSIVVLTRLLILKLRIFFDVHLILILVSLDFIGVFFISDTHGSPSQVFLIISVETVLVFLAFNWQVIQRFKVG